MTRAGVDDPDDAALLVRAVPDAPAGRDLVLPLTEHLAADLTPRESPTQPMLPRRVLGQCRPLGQHDPCIPGVAPCDAAQLLPALRRLRRGEPGLPPVGSRGRRNPVATPGGHRSGAFRSRHRTKISSERTNQLGRQHRIGVDRGGRSPLDDDLGEDRPPAQLRRRGDGADEVGGEVVPIRLRHEVEPGKLLDEDVDGLRGSEVCKRIAQSTRSARRTNGGCVGTVLPHEEQWHAVSAPDTYIAPIGERGDALGVALQFAPLNFRRHGTIMNLFRTLSKSLGALDPWVPSPVTRSKDTGETDGRGNVGTCDRSGARRACDTPPAAFWDRISIWELPRQNTSRASSW